MKCPFCHESFATQAGYQAHVQFCAHKESPLPEPVEKPVNPLDKLNKADLLARSAELGLTLDDALTKKQIVEAIEAETARRASDPAAAAAAAQAASDAQAQKTEAQTGHTTP